tara:strand:- start:36 stop:269 length:234 start_codon:yes stop_codon:yes gene_type:complete
MLTNEGEDVDRDYRSVKLGRPFGDEDSNRLVLAVRVSDRLKRALEKQRDGDESWQRVARRVLESALLTAHGERDYDS